VKLPAQESAPEEAFFYLGEPLPGKIQIIVEDMLAKKIVMKAVKLGGEAFHNQFDVRYYPGGCQTLWQYHLPIFAVNRRSDVFVLLDGDQKPSSALTDPDTIPENQIDVLRAQLKTVAKAEIKFNVDGGTGGTNVGQEQQLLREFIKWVRKYVEYLPGQEPEAFVWDHMQMNADAESVKDIQPIKKRFEALARIELDREDFEEINSIEIMATQERCLRLVPADDSEVEGLYGRLREFATSQGLK
jgi:hypothetical protein